MLPDIENLKEILSVLPKNNIKQNRYYLKRVKEVRETILSSLDQVKREIENRVVKITAIEENKELLKRKEELKSLEENFYLLNEINTSYEKSNLSVILNDLEKYYRSDLEDVNKNIFLAIEKFKEVGVILTIKEFDFGNFVKDYMSVFFMNIDNLEVAILKETFDNVYWKSPEIIINIKNNFRYLYFKHEKAFNNYYNKKKKALNISSKREYEKSYKQKFLEYNNLNNKDIYKLLSKFLSLEHDIREYDQEKMDKLKATLFIEQTDEQSDNLTLLKLNNTLFEYKNYLRYQTIISKIKDIYNDKNNKAIVKPILKQINKEEKNIKKMNARIRRKIFFKKEKADLTKFNNSINASLPVLRDLYRDLDVALFKEKVLSYLKDNSNYLDILQVAYAYKTNLYKLFKEDNEELTEKEFNNEYDNLFIFINYPTNNIINNITILEDKDIPTIIIDNYKLMNINIEKETFDSNLDSFINTVSKLLMAQDIKDSVLKYEDIVFACDANKLLGK